MPTYEFRCPDGTIIERIFKISDAPASIPCPDGTGEAVRIISGGAGLLFKGSGFYITDYGKDGRKDQRVSANAESRSGDSATKEAKTTDSKATESKPDTAKSESNSDSKSETKSESKSGDTSKTSTKSEPAKPAAGGNSSSGSSKGND